MRLIHRPLIALTLAVATIGVARAAAQAEAIPADQIQLYAPFFVQLIQQQFPNAPLKVDASIDKAAGFHVEQKVGVISIPDKALTDKTVEQATEKDSPVAILATKSLSLVEKDALVPAEKVAVANFNDTLKIPVFFLGVKAKEKERLLVVYSKDAQPVATAPLKKTSGEVTALGMKLSNIDLEKKRVDLTVTLPGAYEGTVKLGATEF